eukprot:Hpha_TRINITY_DN13370_c0_g1::TRINITY_DN13370_c0_g1_i1::g.95431::m.95431
MLPTTIQGTLPPRPASMGPRGGCGGGEGGFPASASLSLLCLLPSSKTETPPPPSEEVVKRADWPTALFALLLLHPIARPRGEGEIVIHCPFFFPFFLFTIL